MADFWDKEELVDKLTKNSREEIQIKKVEKSGKKSRQKLPFFNF